MVNKIKPNYGYSAGFFVENINFSEIDLEELGYICGEEGFLDAMKDLTGFFKGHKLNELSSSKISEQRTALAELEKLTDSLASALIQLDSDTSELIVSALEYNISPLFFNELVNGPLDRLTAGVELARRKIEESAGPPRKSAERVTLFRLKNLFEQYDLDMPSCDGDEEVTYSEYITGTDFYTAAVIILLSGWPNQSEWPSKRPYSELKESAINGYVIDLIAEK